MKIHIMGASCAGSTTLGKALAEKLQYVYLDTDAYFWQPSAIPFTVRRDPAERNMMIKETLAINPNAIVGGSVINWGDEWIEMFQLVVFLYIPREIRMQRLKAREIERYGDKIYTDPVYAENYKKFMEWASGYDDNTTTGRNLNAHKNWLTKLTCPILEINGDISVPQRLNLVLAKLGSL